MRDFLVSVYKYPSKDLTAKVALGYPLPIFARRSVAGGSSARAPGNQNNESTRLRLSHLIKYAKIYPWQGSVLKRRSSFAAKKGGADFDFLGAAPQAAAKSGVNCFRYLKPDDFRDTKTVSAKIFVQARILNSGKILIFHFRQSPVLKLAMLFQLDSNLDKLKSKNHNLIIMKRHAYLLTFGALQKSPKW